MSADPTEALLNSMGASLAANAGVISAFGGAGNVRVFQVFPPIGQAGSRQYPFVAFGDVDVVDLENACSRDVEVFVTVYVWDQSSSNTRCRAIASAVREALYRNVSVTGWRVIIADHERTRSMQDYEVSVQRAVLEFRLVMQPD